MSKKKTNPGVKFQKIHWSINACTEKVELFNDDGLIVFKFKCSTQLGNNTMRAVLVECPGLPTGVPPWEKMQAYTKIVGATPTQVLRIAKAVRQRLLHQSPNWYKLVRTGKSGRIPSNRLFHSCINSDIIDQAYKDGIHNIAPILNIFGKEPSECKNILGKSLWKSLCKNSYTRNQKIMLTVDRESSIVSIDNKDQGKVNFIKALQARPSSLLDNRHLYSENMKYLLKAKESLKSWKALKTGRGALTIHKIKDAERMAKDLGMKFSLNWNYERIEALHTRLTEQYQQLQQQRYRLQNEEYAKRQAILEAVDISTLHKGCEFDELFGVKITLLKNMKEIQEEGVKMKHCVAGYGSSAAEGTYLVYHLEKGDVEATLGIYCDSTFTYTFSQCYGARNAILEDKAFREAANEIVKKLNSVNKELHV